MAGENKTTNVIQPLIGVQSVCVLVAGVALLLKILGQAEISWIEILLVATFPLWAAVGTFLVVIAFLFVAFVVCISIITLMGILWYGFISLLCFWEWIVFKHSETKRKKALKNSKSL